MYRIGIDLGGINIACGLVTEDGKLIAKKSVPTRAKNDTPDGIAKSMVDENGITSAGSFARSGDVEATDWQNRRYSGTVRMSSTMHFESARRQSASPSAPSSMRNSSLRSEN